MIGPRYVPTTKQKVFHDMDYQKHRKKLDEIVQEDRKKKTLDPEVEKRKKMNDLRLHNFKFQNFEKSQAIDKDNQILLGRLVEISKQKKPKLFKVQSETTIPRTLNAPYRKRELERIANENEALARRLLTQNSAFSIKKLETDFEKNRVLLKQVQKLTPSPKGKGKLPPLSGPQTTKAGNAKKIKMPERVDKRSASHDPEKKSEHDEDTKTDEPKPESNGQHNEHEKKENAKPTNAVAEDIHDETEPPKQNDKQQTATQEVKKEDATKPTTEKKDNPAPENTTNQNNNISGPPIKTGTENKQPEKKEEAVNIQGDKSNTNVNTENKPKDTTASQSNVDKKGGNSKNPSKTDIK